MARKTKFTVADLTGESGKTFIVKILRGKRFISKSPDLSKVVPTEKQRKQRALFAKAVAFAKRIKNTPHENSNIKVAEGQSFFQAAVRYYMKVKSGKNV